MSSASDDRSHLTIDGWGSSWDVGPDMSSDDADRAFPVDDEPALAHWGGVEAGEAWSEQVWDSAAWGAAALHVDGAEPDSDSEPLWPSRTRLHTGPRVWRATASAAQSRYKTFDRQLPGAPVLAPLTLAFAPPALDTDRALAPLMAESLLWPTRRLRHGAPKAVSADRLAEALTSTEPRRAAGEPFWPAAARRRPAASSHLTPRPRVFGPTYSRALGISDAVIVTSLPTPIPVTVAVTVLGPMLADALSAPVLQARDRRFGPPPPETIRADELRETLRRRPRVGQDRAVGALAIGALFDALATEREASETLDRLSTLERSSAEAAEAEAVARRTASVKSAGAATAVALLDDVSFDMFDADEGAMEEDEGEALDAFSRPLAGPPAGSLTAGLLAELRRDLGRQIRPRRRVAVPAPSGRRAS